jgi:lipopolysaccharide/colanic/teichoic acid biosynthesis glycosyltransferase
MTDEQHFRLTSAARAARLGDDDEDAASALADSSTVVTGLHVVRGDSSTGTAASPSFQAEGDFVTIIQPTYFAKRAFDILGAVLLGLLFSPLILIIVALIRIEGQPVLFWHKRIGRNGRSFHCVKFRTMVRDAEHLLRRLLNEHPELRDEWTKNFKLLNDPRITMMGRVLRFTSLDELPQLWNVLRGEMSLVGPRPIVRAELLRYGRNASRYLAVKPGLTGLWQVKGRSSTTYRRRVAMDKYYIQNQSILLDIYILAATPAAVLKRNGAC